MRKEENAFEVSDRESFLFFHFLRSAKFITEFPCRCDFNIRRVTKLIETILLRSQ